MIFIAPDDGHAYSVNYARGLAVSEIFMEHDEFVTLVRVRSETRPITITEWFPVTQAYLDGPPVPTLDQLKARWDANRADDAAEAEDAGW
jgi:hypothetical protein